MQTLQEIMENESPVLDMSKEQFVYSQTPIGKALYRHKINRYTKPYDRLTCGTCGKVYSRSGVTNHKKTQFHQLHENMNKKFKELFIN